MVTGLISEVSAYSNVTSLRNVLELLGGELLHLPCGFVIELKECTEDNGVSADAVVDPSCTASLARGLPLFVNVENVSIACQNRGGYNTMLTHCRETHLNSLSSAF